MSLRAGTTICSCWRGRRPSKSVEILSIQSHQQGARRIRATSRSSPFQMAGACASGTPRIRPVQLGPHLDSSTAPNHHRRQPSLRQSRRRHDLLVADPTEKVVFTLKDGDLSFDIANSHARADRARFAVPGAAEAAHHPRRSALKSGRPPSRRSIASLGFVGISAPIDQSKLSAPWYGLSSRIVISEASARWPAARALTLELLVGGRPPIGHDAARLFGGESCPARTASSAQACRSRAY